MARELEHIRQYVVACVGRDVELVCSERRRTQCARAVIVGAYPTVFTLLCEDGRRVSYTYADLFTRSVSIRLLA